MERKSDLQYLQGLNRIVKEGIPDMIAKKRVVPKTKRCYNFDTTAWIML